MNFSTIFADQASDKEAKDLVGDVHQPMNETYAAGYTAGDSCTGNAKTCLLTANCYSCRECLDSHGPSL